MIEKLKELLRTHCPGWTPKVIADIGANNGSQTAELAEEFASSTVLALECHPGIWPACLDRVAGLKNVIMLPLAANSVDGPVKFFKPLTSNTGYGSLFQPNGEYPLEPTPSEETVVNAVRLDTLLRGLHIPAIDLFWLDAQGGELAILTGLGSLIEGTRVVWTEYMDRAIYVGQPLIGQLEGYLMSKGLSRVWSETQVAGWWGDACFVRK
jgi:FkbM family methyltransferase